MKFPPLFSRRRLPRVLLHLYATLLLNGAGCSSSEPTVLQVQPSTPAGPAAPAPLSGDPGTPEGPGTFGLPGPEPASAPPENDGPGATETNFLTPPCRIDAECGAGRRCIGGGRAADDSDAGQASAEEDAGLSSDAGLGLGFCQALPDAG